MLILPREFPELKALIQRISGGGSCSRSPDLAPLPGRIGERTVDPNRFDVVDEILIYNTENRNPQRLDRVVLYQPGVGRFRRIYRKDPRYHILHCSTIQEMQRIGSYARYVPTSRADGKFLVNLNGREDEVELLVCQNCLNLLRERYGAGVFPQDPEEFSLADWLETFEFDYSSEVWEETSRACRENANWRCEQCGIDLEFHRHLLHAHHRWGDAIQRTRGSYGTLHRLPCAAKRRRAPNAEISSSASAIYAGVWCSMGNASPGNPKSNLHGGLP